MNIDKLQELFDERWSRLVESEDFREYGDHAWPLYCQEHNIKFSDETSKVWVCVENPEYESSLDQGSESPKYLHIPKEFAAKSLAMGGLP